MKKEQSPRIIISASEELRAKLNAEAVRTGKSAAQIARTAIENYLSRSLLSEATKIQAPLEEKINFLLDENNYLKNMIEGVYRSLNYLTRLEEYPSELKRLGDTQTVVKDDLVKATARKKANQSYREMKQSSLSIGDYLEDFLRDENSFEEEEEEPVHYLSQEELDAYRKELTNQMNNHPKFAEQMEQETPKELEQLNKQEPVVEEPKKEQPRRVSTADKLIGDLFGN